VSNETITYIVSAGCGAIALIAFCTLVLVPAMTSYRGPLARVGVFVLSLYVFAAFIGIGVLVGAFVILKWPEWF
jgi:hypothetical protein